MASSFYRHEEKNPLTIMVSNHH